MQSNATLKTPGKDTAPWYAHRWPWLLMLGPAAVVVAGVHTTYLAYSNQDALVVDDYYKQGKAINHDLSRDRVAAGMKAEAGLGYDAARGQLRGSLRSFGQPLSGKFTLQLVHSTQPEKDVRLTVETDAGGAFTAPLPMLDIGRWAVQIEPDQRAWRLHGEWNWPQEREIRLLPPAP
ncbi:FixH family protein [Noviherbaspirillum aridicola]|uniref:Cytochrome oxidase assembly protein n=1 Tax=Noviherbaspirillum aridicola TaxID=2849687 RepID=A0ABQ4Q4E5_9BURK|nr:FixH family protein [Noviherbaspirillum aridicola]GIZ51670.1 hypothetical protein NCCP691_16840 [Noviherbaspirillum aridicola]